VGRVLLRCAPAPLPQRHDSQSSPANAPTSKSRFNAAYYRRFYLDAKTRAVSREETETRANLIGALLNQLDVQVKKILDVGCGLGWYERPLRRIFGDISYTGTEWSEYLCRRKGWIHGSIARLKFRDRFDLVICSDVMQYLDERDATRALRNLRRWCRGALYFHVPTQRDWLENVDRSATDAEVNLRSAAWYRNRLRRHFVHVGCGGAP